MKQNNLLDLRDNLDMSITEVKTLIVLLGFYLEGNDDPTLENSFWLLSEKIDAARKNANKLYQAINKSSN